MRKIICLMLSLLIVLFCGCTKTQTQTIDPTYSDFYKGINVEVINDYLAKEGQSSYKIVIPKNAIPVEQQGATELQNYVQQVSGALLPIIQDTETVEGEVKYFSIGNTTLFQNSGIYYEGYGITADGFLLKNIGKTVYVMSEDNRGILYGVYEFLEKIMDIRFFAPDETYIPTLKEIPVYDMEIASSPYFAERSYMNGLEFGRIMTDEFVAHSRGINYWISMDEKFGGNSAIYSRPRTNGNVDHNFIAYVDPKVYEESHPEFYWNDSNSYGPCKMLDIVNGITADGELDETMEISVLKIMIAELKKDILAHPDAKYFLVEQEDGPNAINKERYPDLIEKYGASGVLVRSMNVVCREIQEWADEELNGRKINIVTFAYQQTKEPPVKTNDKGEYEALDASVIPVENLVIRLALFPNSYYSYFDEENQNSGALDFYLGWSAICENFMFWAYDIDFHDYLNYFPSWQSMRDNVEGWRDAGVKCLMIQSPHNTTTNWQTNLRHYVYSKLFWDCNQDVSFLMKEYINGYYGVIGGEYVQKFIAIMDSHYAIVMADEANKDLSFVSNTSLGSAPYVNVGVLTSAMNILQEGIQKVATSALSDAQKSKYLTRLYGVLSTPAWMILNNYDTFYPGDAEGKNEHAKMFFEVCEKGEVDQYNEVFSIIELKQQYGG